MHENRLTHTDLKPENILLVNSEDSVMVYNERKKTHLRRPRCTDIRVIDLGSATYEDSHHTRIVSTRHYRAPEILLGWSLKPPESWFAQFAHVWPCRKPPPPSPLIHRTGLVNTLRHVEPGLHHIRALYGRRALPDTRQPRAPGHHGALPRPNSPGHGLAEQEALLQQHRHPALALGVVQQRQHPLYPEAAPHQRELTPSSPTFCHGVFAIA